MHLVRFKPRLACKLRVTATGRLHFQDIIFYVRVLLQRVVEKRVIRAWNFWDWDLTPWDREVVEFERCL